MIDIPPIELIEIPQKNAETALAPVNSSIWEEFLMLQISPATKRAYASALKDFFRREFGVPVSPGAIESYLSLGEREGIGRALAYRGKLLESSLSSATINLRITALKSFVSHAAKLKLCQYRLDDIRGIKAEDYKDTRGISVDEFRSLIGQIDRSTPIGKRNYAMMRLLWDNALRRAEVCGLDCTDFHPEEARLYLKGKGRRDKSPLDLAGATVDAISEWLGSMSDSTNPALFTTANDTRLCAEQLRKIVAQLGKDAGIDRVMSPHRIRHSSITAFLDATDGDVRSAQAHSRHKNLATLIRYDDGRQQLQGRAAKVLADLI